VEDFYVKFGDPIVFITRRYASAVYAVVCPYVCLSVTVPVAKRRITQRTPYDSFGTL